MTADANGIALSAPLADAPGPAVIKLQNPVSHHFPAFIFGNAVEWEKMAAEELARANPQAALDLAATASTMDRADYMAAFRAALFTNSKNRFVVEQNSAKGQHLVLCGAGPSLNEHAGKWCPQADQIWGCNSALTWLHQNGHKPTHGFCIDQTASMLAEWATAPDVDYILASTVHVHLTEYLRSKNRRIQFFHNYVGIQRPPVEMPGENGEMERMDYEEWMYVLLYPGTIKAGSGLNSVTRALDVALFMGFDKITILGADCCLRAKKPRPKDALPGTEARRQWLRDHVTMHADGGSALASGASEVTIDAEIDGREWITKVDLVVSAKWLMEMKQHFGNRVSIIGDTLVKAFAYPTRADGMREVMYKGKKTLMTQDRFLRELPALQSSDGKILPFFEANDAAV